MNTDIRLSIGFWSHPKTKKTMRRLGLEGVRSLQVLWLWAAVNKPTGLLADMDEEDIELAADWPGENGAFFQHCLGMWIDQTNQGYQLHQWEDHNPWQSIADERTQRARNAAITRWRKYDEKKNTPTDAHATARPADLTQTFKTKTKQKKQTNAGTMQRSSSNKHTNKQDSSTETSSAVHILSNKSTLISQSHANVCTSIADACPEQCPIPNHTKPNPIIKHPPTPQVHKEEQHSTTASQTQNTLEPGQTISESQLIDSTSKSCDTPQKVIGLEQGVAANKAERETPWQADKKAAWQPRAGQVLNLSDFSDTSPGLDFEQFFQAYPETRRGSRRFAQRQWQNLYRQRQLPKLHRLLEALTAWIESQTWQREAGRFIPSAGNFLAREYWLQQPDSASGARASQPTTPLTEAQKNKQNLAGLAAFYLSARKELENGREADCLDAIGKNGHALPPAHECLAGISCHAASLARAMP